MEPDSNQPNVCGSKRGLQCALSRFNAQITRVEAHLSNVNSDQKGRFVGMRGVREAGLGAALMDARTVIVAINGKLA